MKRPSIPELVYGLVLEFGNLLKTHYRRLFLSGPDRLFLVLLFLFLVMTSGYFGWRLGVEMGEELNVLLPEYLLTGVMGGVWISVNLFRLKWKLGGSRKLQIHPPSLNRVSNFADFWGLGLRKRIKAVAGDYDVEVKRLHKEKRYRMAKWNVVLAWGYAIWYVLRGPYDLVKGAMVKALKGL